MNLSRATRVCVPLLLLGGAAAAPDAQAQPLSFYYVAGATGAGSDVPDKLPVVDRTHPLGYFSFLSPGRTFTLMLDDTGTLTGATIPVSISDGKKGARYCISARTPVRLPGRARGAEIFVFVETPSDRPNRCSGTGTTGTAYVTP